VWNDLPLLLFIQKSQMSKSLNRCCNERCNARLRIIKRKSSVFISFEKSNEMSSRSGPKCCTAFDCTTNIGVTLTKNDRNLLLERSTEEAVHGTNDNSSKIDIMSRLFYVYSVCHRL
jgi:hypothetical protein